MNPLPTVRLFALLAVLAPVSAAVAPQDPKPKGPDKEVADKIATLKDVVLDRKMARDDEGRQIIDDLLIKMQAGLDPKDEKDVVKALDSVFMRGKVRPHDDTKLYYAAAAALGYCGTEGAKVLKNAFESKRFDDNKDWVPLREQLLKYLGRTKDESMVKWLTKIARTDVEAALQAAAGDALGNFEESKEQVRKDIVEELMTAYGSLAEKAGQMGSSNIEAQNAQNRLATLQDKWHSTLAKMTRQNFTTFREWQTWYNKNKNLPW
ncbi:MAG TPA: hypothetical protein VFZ65_18785 [Planctomycetota bacterium]|nr:hypothetical protein [Planctomycetota bacterium]